MLMKLSVVLKIELLKKLKDDLEFLFLLMSLNEVKMKILCVVLIMNLLRKFLVFLWMLFLILGDDVMILLKYFFEF